MLTKQQLIDFEEDIANCFEQKMIKAPIHLENGSEDKLIDIFDYFKIGQNDWVCGTWRSHLPVLLKGVPPDEVKQEILAGRSISLCFPEHKVISSAIVGGIIPIAMGIAKGISLNKSKERVFCFIGDMSALTGAFAESQRYAQNFDLPVYWMIGDNAKSVCTDTKESWGLEKHPYSKFADHCYWSDPERIIYYEYTNSWPHSGGMNRIQF